MTKFKNFAVPRRLMKHLAVLSEEEVKTILTLYYFSATSKSWSIGGALLIIESTAGIKNAETVLRALEAKGFISDLSITPIGLITGFHCYLRVIQRKLPDTLAGNIKEIRKTNER